MHICSYVLYYKTDKCKRGGVTPELLQNIYF
jgi:hypothetical protein